MVQPLLLIAAGGTGGHMFPAQALAEAMVAKGWRVKLSTDARGARYAGNYPASVIVEEGPRMITNIIGDDALDVQIGDKVSVAFKPGAEGDTLPVFRRA